MSKKLIITAEELDSMGMTGPDYDLRFRIVSEDRNRFSSWTPIFSISDPNWTPPLLG